jgi:aspartyl-tRNA(Asn)/glutamyl-tRNA(Gln) amidotransferase subunit A
MGKLNELTIVQARQGLQDEGFTITELTQACLDKIEQTDDDIQAFMTVCKDKALAQAKEYDKQLKDNPDIFKQKPLFGIPIAVKDNYCTKGIRTTASSKVLDNFIPPYDATVIKRIKDAGAIIIGKTNMDAWAHGSSTETSAYFTTKNPHDLSRVPGGSSGGSAAAVAANQVIAGLGTETAGSIRQPAAWCGVVGMKPTYGRVSRWGVIAMASSTDSPGPLTKTVEDAAIMLAVIAGHDEKDATSSPKEVSNYYEKLNDKKEITLGVPKEYFLDDMDEDVKKLVKQAIADLEKQGIKTKKVSLLDPKYSIAVYTIVQRAEVSSNLARYDGIRYGQTRKEFGQEAKRRIMLGTYALSAGYYDQYYAKAQKVRTLIQQDFNKVFKEVDALIAPTSPTPALKIGESADNPMFGENQDVLVEASSLAGLPGISINCGFSNDLPVGMQIFAPQFKESLVMQIAHLYESINHG